MNDTPIEQTVAAVAEPADDMTGFFIVEFVNEIRRQMAIARAMDTANAMADIVRKYYP